MPSTKSPRQERVYDLEERLLNFSVLVIDVSEKLPKTRAGNHVAGQLLRAGTSPYANHGEAQAPESRDDFIHKMKICLKELRETRRWARLVDRECWMCRDVDLPKLPSESGELIRIFKASIQTAERNGSLRPRKKWRARQDCVMSLPFKVQGSKFKVRCSP